MGSQTFHDRTFHLTGGPLVSTEADLVNDQHLSAHAPTHHHHQQQQQQQQQREEHLKAIGVLKDEADRCIFAGLDVARSFESRIQHCSNSAWLTRDQVNAILALRHCKNDDISAWLDLARAPGGPAVPTLSASHHVSPALDPGHSAPIIISDASPPALINHSCEKQANQQDDTQGSSTQPSPPATITPPQAKPKYYCTICALCDRFRPFKNESDWKKHEKEHDTDYVCMLGGPKEATSQGIQCVFCGIQNPDDAHLSRHNAQACSPGLPEAFSTKRRYEMVSHLKAKHGITTASQGEAIAGKWKYTVEKQAWSCCFCVKFFASFNKRLSHIATEHYGHGDTIEECDATNVIQGLLQQPRMIKAWEEKMTSLPPWEVQDIIWERNAIKDLQQDLEVGPSDEKTAVILAEAAYTACRMNWGMESKRLRAVAEPEVDGTNDTTTFSSSWLTAPTTCPTISVSNQNQPPSIFREPDGLCANDLVNQDNSQVDYTYSSDFMPDWYDDEGQDSLLSANYHQA